MCPVENSARYAKSDQILSECMQRHRKETQCNPLKVALYIAHVLKPTVDYVTPAEVLPPKIVALFPLRSE